MGWREVIKLWISIYKSLEINKIWKERGKITLFNSVSQVWRAAEKTTEVKDVFSFEVSVYICLYVEIELHIKIEN